MYMLYSASTLLLAECHRPTTSPIGGSNARKRRSDPAVSFSSTSRTRLTLRTLESLHYPIFCFLAMVLIQPYISLLLFHPSPTLSLRND